MGREKLSTEKSFRRWGKLDEEEKRLSKRLQRRFILRAAIFGDKPLHWSYVTIHNISPSGIFFTFDRPVKVGHLLHFKVDFPDRVLECMGRVRRLVNTASSTMWNVGANFEGISAENREYIENFIRLNSPA